MAKKRHILITNETIEYYAIGVVSSDTEFQLSMLLNSILPNNLILTKPVFKEINSKQISFARFKFDNEENLQCILIKNKNKGYYLFQNQQSFDFIIVLSGDEAGKTAKEIVSGFKNGTNINLVTSIETKKLRNLKEYIN